VDVLHVLHEGLVAEEELVTQGTAGRVGSANQGRVLSNIKRWRIMNENNTIKKKKNEMNE
jgi:hypothetical protein